MRLLALKYSLLLSTLVCATWTQECPQKCVCGRKTMAECTSLDIEPFPERLQITTLIVKDAKQPLTINGETWKQLHLEGLETLVLDNVNIAHLDQSAFSTGNIRTLQIKNALIPKLDKSILSNSPYMTQVYIEKSRIQFNGFESSKIKELALIECNLTTIPNDAFLNLPSLEWLNLEHNRIENFDHIDLPLGELNLSLSYNLIQRMHVSTNLLSSLSNLHLSHNPLTHLTIVENVDLPLEELNLESTQLNNLKFLRNTSDLTVLSLKNALKSIKIKENDFDTLNGLLHLDLSSNGLTELPTELFRNNPLLSSLILDDNNFTSLPVFYTPVGGLSLMRFSCNNCGIRTLDKNTFNFIKMSDRIELRNNMLRELPEALFNNVKFTYIDLSNNQLQNLPPNIFKNNNRLRSVNLSNNPLRQITTNLFENCYELIELELNNCALSLLWNSASFPQLPSLIRLSAENNHIFEVNHNQLSYTPNLKVLSLIGNPLKCDEDYINLRSEMKQTLVNYLDPLNKTCNSDDQIIEVIDEDTTTKEEDIISSSEQEDNYFMTDTEDVIKIESTRFNKDEREEVRRDLILYLLPTFIFVLTALIVLLVIVSVAMCVLHKKRQSRRVRAFENRFWIPKKHSGTVYKPLSEEKLPVYM